MIRILFDTGVRSTDKVLPSQAEWTSLYNKCKLMFLTPFKRSLEECSDSIDEGNLGKLLIMDVSRGVFS